MLGLVYGGDMTGKTPAMSAFAGGVRSAGKD
jgi:hypothetical protein